MVSNVQNGLLPGKATGLNTRSQRLVAMAHWWQCAVHAGVMVRVRFLLNLQFVDLLNPEDFIFCISAKDPF
jgi:hypothetical protein